jgi:hypothetical protein
MVCIATNFMVIYPHALEQPLRSLIDVAFLTRDEILLLLRDEDASILIFGVFSVPEQKVFVVCRLPFPDTHSNSKHT